MRNRLGMWFRHYPHSLQDDLLDIFVERMSSFLEMLPNTLALTYDVTHDTAELWLE